MPLQLRQILANAVVAAGDNRRDVTLSWLAAAQEFAKEMERERASTSTALSVRWSRSRAGRVVLLARSRRKAWAHDVPELRLLRFPRRRSQS